MRLEAVMVCVDYGDFLNITLPYNKRQFDDITVVTTKNDIETINICRKNDVKVVTTDKMYENGARFNKGKALNEGIKKVDKSDWVLITDADMAMDINLRSILESKDLDEDSIYGTSRYMCPNYNEWLKYLKEPLTVNEWAYQRRKKTVGVGFFQLVNGCCDILKENDKWYSENYGHCGRSDRMFLNLFPAEKRGRLRAPCIHLGDDEMSTNWCGRITNRFN